jgi:hypothetical protein
MSFPLLYASRKRSVRTPAWVRPRLETLEDRCVPDANLSGLVVQAPNPVEGPVFSNTSTIAVFSDPTAKASEFTVTADWGDGTNPITIPGPFGSIADQGNGTFAVTAGHIFFKAGTYTLNVTVSDNSATRSARPCP